MRPIVLLTDFGAADHYVGVLHAVLDRIAPGARRIDLGHAVPPGDVWTGCYLLRAAWPYLPDDAVVLVVVDPGVGTGRAALAAAVGGRWIVAPDNGLAPAPGAVERAIALDPAEVSERPPSSTFHGRDLFAPAAGRLARGDEPSALGEEVAVAELVGCPLPEPTRADDRARGQVLHVDRFGNIVTNLPGSWLADDARVRCSFHHLSRRVTTYGQAPPSEPVFLIGSDGLVEIAIRGASAAQILDVAVGDAVELLPGSR